MASASERKIASRELRQHQVENAGGAMEKCLGRLEAASRIAVETTGNW